MGYVGTFNKEKIFVGALSSKYCENYHELLLTPLEHWLPHINILHLASVQILNGGIISGEEKQKANFRAALDNGAAVCICHV